jgi:hypothetical protein
MMDKTGQEFRLAFEAGEFATDTSAQMTAVGMGMKPDSSGKTRWAPLRREFFHARPFFALPPRNFPLIPLTGAPFRVFWGLTVWQP